MAIGPLSPMPLSQLAQFQHPGYSGGGGGGNWLELLGGAANPIGLGVSALTSVVGGIAGAANASRARRANERRYQQIIELMRRGQRAQQTAYQQAGDTQRRAVKASNEGFDRARGEVNQVGAASRQMVRDQGQMALGYGTQGLISRGQATGSRVGSLARGIRADTGRSLAQVNQGVAGARSSIEAQRGQAQASALSMLADHYRRRGAALQHSYGQTARLMFARDDVAAPHWLSALGAAGLNYFGRRNEAGQV